MEFGGLVAVKDVSFEVKKGEFIGLIGPNGCGKSTTIGMMLGLIKPTSGAVLINGKNIDYEKRESEGGIFIWKNSPEISTAAAIASIIMAELTFKITRNV